MSFLFLPHPGLPPSLSDKVNCSSLCVFIALCSRLWPVLHFMTVTGFVTFPLLNCELLRGGNQVLYIFISARPTTCLVHSRDSVSVERRDATESRPPAVCEWVPHDDTQMAYLIVSGIWSERRDLKWTHKERFLRCRDCAAEVD